MLESILRFLEKFIPRRLYRMGQPTYHYLLAFLGALLYRFPSQKIKIVAVTGTKGKTSVVELVNAMLEEAGHTTSLASTLRFKIADESARNLRKMSVPGRFFLQSHLRKAVRAGCDWAILEMTSEAAKQFRHKFISFDALIFTNIAPEHIESHGSFEKYRDAKLKLAHAVSGSSKRPRIIVANANDAVGKKFLSVPVDQSVPFSLSDAKPYEVRERGATITYKGVKIETPLSGAFNIENILASATFATAAGVSTETVRAAVEKFSGIPGRVEFIQEGQDFSVVVDYAHTPDSLEKLYEAFGYAKKICVLGNTGGGRDTWKRPEMAHIAAAHCAEIILTNEDPYNEDPEKIVREMAEAIPGAHPDIILDRREAIRAAISRAQTGDAVLITGKGTDPYIMTANNTKIPWDDRDVAREELRALKRNF